MVDMPLYCCCTSNIDDMVAHISRKLLLFPSLVMQCLLQICKEVFDYKYISGVPAT